MKNRNYTPRDSNLKMKRPQSTTVLFIMLLLVMVTGRVWSEQVYSPLPLINVRQGPGLDTEIIAKLRHGRWIEVLEKTGDWLKVKLPPGITGYVRSDLVTKTWIQVLKDEHRLQLMKERQVVKEYTIGLGFNPKNDKVKQGDGCTPEGRFYICETIIGPKPSATYGPISLRISYPNIEDARRGLKDKLISLDQYTAIVEAINDGVMPPQNTILGSSIKIHGGTFGASSDWTLGCIALANDDLKDLFSQIPQERAVIVEIYRSAAAAKRLNEPGYVNREILAQAERMIAQGCTYTAGAIAIIPIPFPMGDFDQLTGVCTDIVIRALRGAGIDLQALLYEDIMLHPQLYPDIPYPDTNIDHRRTRNLRVYFENNAQVLTTGRPQDNPGEYQPGDIVVMDTGIDNGTIYDHIGIVSPNKNGNGIPRVINLWTVGWNLVEMELLNGYYPAIVGHYRLLEPLYYDAVIR